MQNREDTASSLFSLFSDFCLVIGFIGFKNLKIPLLKYSAKKMMPFSAYSSNIAVERYLSPVSGRSTTIFLPLFSSIFPS